jgi:radical SAM-linked protein
MGKVKVRIRFSKTGDLRWISHRDLARVWERLLRRAGLQLAFSEGFHPKPRISFPSALALGIAALEEIVELELVDPVDMSLLQTLISGQLPAGMQLLSIEPLAAGAPKSSVVSMTYEIPLPAEYADRARHRAAELMADGKLVVERDGKFIGAAFEAGRFEIACDQEVLRFTLPANAQGSLRPIEVLEALDVAQAQADGAVLTRTHVTLGHASPSPAAAPDGEAAPSDQDESLI